MFVIQTYGFVYENDSSRLFILKKKKTVDIVNRERKEGRKNYKVCSILLLFLFNLSNNQLPEFGNRNEEVDAEDKF